MSKTKVTIIIEYSDIADLKSHLSLAREQILYALKNEHNLDEPIQHEGMGSGHTITIEKE